MGAMRVRIAKTLIRMQPRAIMKLKGTKRMPAPREEMPLTIWRRWGMSIIMMLYGMPERRERIKVPIHALLKRKRQGKTGSGRQLSPVTMRSLTRKNKPSSPDSTKSTIAVLECHENSLGASRRTVTRSNVDPRRSSAPDRSSLASDAFAIFCLKVGAT